MVLLYLSVVIVWVTFDRVASMTGSMRGESGLLVCAVVLVATWLSARLLTGGAREATRALGLGKPTARSLIAVIVISCGLLVLWLAVTRRLNIELELLPGSAALAFGMFAQGGVAEEVRS